MSLKILYAASNSIGSKIRLYRFLNAIKDKNYNIKIAAYIKSSPNVSIDWTLDALLNIYDPKKICFDNNVLKIYMDQIKYFNPDLIISDLEVFTSYIANTLNIKCWQVSPLLLNKAIPHYVKYNIGLYKNYSSLSNSHWTSDTYMANLIVNSDRKLVYSYFCDTNYFDLNNGYEWVRPYYLDGKKTKTSEHNMIAITPECNKKIISFAQSHSDSIIFSEKNTEKFNGVINKSYLDEQEYACNLSSSNVILHEGHTSFMADCFYNKKYPFMIPDFINSECTMNSLFADYFNIGKIINSKNLPSNEEQIDFTFNKNSMYLHQRIEQL